MNFSFHHRSNRNAACNVDFCDGQMPVRVLENPGSHAHNLDVKSENDAIIFKPRVKEIEWKPSAFRKDSRLKCITKILQQFKFY